MALIRAVYLSAALCGLAIGAWACNEAVCASLVSKCMLLKSCECNMMDKTNCTCCKDCHKCLAKLYTECCSCVGMCAATNPKDNLFKTSTVEELNDPIPGLFNVLTEEEDPFLRWTTYTYPTHLDLLYFKPRGEDKILNLTQEGDEGHTIRHGHHRVTFEPSASAQNCTVAYMSQCIPLNKCRSSCQSMGAARYRWFHDHGCCECIGSTCLHFGKGEPLCHKCPDEDEENDKDADYYDYEVDENVDSDEDEDFKDEENTKSKSKPKKGGIAELEGEEKILDTKDPQALNSMDLPDNIHESLDVKQQWDTDEWDVNRMDMNIEDVQEDEEDLEDEEFEGDLEDMDAFQEQ